MIQVLNVANQDAVLSAANLLTQGRGEVIDEDQADPNFPLLLVRFEGVHKGLCIKYPSSDDVEMAVMGLEMDLKPLDYEISGIWQREPGKQWNSSFNKMPDMRRRQYRIPSDVSVTIGAATSEDAAGIAALDHSLWGEKAAYPVYLYRQLLEVFPSTLLVARDAQDNVRGYASALVNTESRTGWVLGVDVDPALHGRGVGTELIKDLLKAFEAQKLRQVQVIIREDNQASRKLFAKLGFDVLEKLPNYFGDGQDQLKYYLLLRQ